MSFVRKYWIAGLVILLVTIHAVIIGYVRSEATRLKTVASSEIPVGLFYKQSSDRKWLTQLRIHIQVPPERRLVARATIEHNRWTVHEAIEQVIRGLDEELLLDPALIAVKEEITRAVNEVLHEELVEQVVINDRVDLDVHEFHVRPSDDLIAPGEESHAARTSTLTSVRPLRPSLSEQKEGAEGEHGEGEHGEGEHGEGEHGEGEHGESDAHGAPAASSHGASSSSSHSKPAAHAKPSGHAAPAKSSHGAEKASSHGAAKKPAAAGHGAAKKAKSSGH